MLNPMFDTLTNGIVYTTNPNAVDPIETYQILGEEFGKDAFTVMLDASKILVANGFHMMHRKADKTSVMHPGDLDTVANALYDQYLTAQFATV